MKTALVSLLSLVLFACSHDKPAETASTSAATAPEHKEAGDHGKDEHGALPPAVKAFHDEMAPLWHADKSADRTAKTCEHAPALQQKAAAVGDKDLIDATSALAAECTKSDRKDFETKFADVHTKFHKAAEASEKH